MSINQEKQDIIDTKGNILVTANPGTGKTLLLAHKFMSLVKEGIKPEKILCLTFTEKAKKEMEERILKLREDQNLNFEISRINVFTFHSYALSGLDDREIISSNLLRFSIYLYIREQKILTYSDKYILDTLVPKIENLIRYLKSFGILPGDIDINKSRKFLPKKSKVSPGELEKFLEEFVKIYLHYEEIKQSQGFDYADLLIEYLKLSKRPEFDYVLVDELQDVNKMEAEIALKSAKKFISVGDKKQAIFGFQGGSIINFDLFKESTHFVLSENFRSTNQVLNFSKEYFISNTADSTHKEELKDLNNALGVNGNKPKIIEVEKGKIIRSAVSLLKQISSENKSTAVILRTNYQIMEIGKELDNLGIEYSTTFFSGSEDAKNDIITFLRGVLSKNIQEVKNAMFTPYFPISIQDAFEYADKKYEKLDGLLEDCKNFKELRKSVKTKFDLMKLFRELIVPVSISYGKQYYSASEKISSAFFESLSLLENKKLDYIFDYLQSYDLATDEIEEEKKIVLTTIHKAKGKEFDNVIYLPSSTRNQTNFVDEVVEAILKSEGINAEEELEEEILRINFVAFTRAKESLFIITDKAAEYTNDASENISISSIDLISGEETDSFKKDAYSLFVNREYEKAKQLLENNNFWLVEFIHNHFGNLKNISFTSAKPKPFEYLVNNIMNIKEYSPALKMGSELHLAAEKYLKGEDHEIDEDYLPFQKNIIVLTEQIRSSYPELFEVEKFFDIPFSDISELKDSLSFRGKIDAVFKNGDNYLIIDWKTDRNNSRSSEHRQQLESYKNAFCELNNIENDNVDVGIAYIGLRPSVNTGFIDCELDMKNPSKSSFNTFISKVEKILEWKNDPDLFLKDLSEEKVKTNERLWRSVVDQYIFEITNE
ncbi:MAG: UvrD-helicase domain-containing protein [Thermodesulfobacteriota bacterium]